MVREGGGGGRGGLLYVSLLPPAGQSVTFGLIGRIFIFLGHFLNV